MSKENQQQQKKPMALSPSIVFIPFLPLFCMGSKKALRGCSSG
jgi:hypothetical protein